MMINDLINNQLLAHSENNVSIIRSTDMIILNLHMKKYVVPGEYSSPEGKGVNSRKTIFIVIGICGLLQRPTICAVSSNTQLS